MVDRMAMRTWEVEEEGGRGELPVRGAGRICGCSAAAPGGVLLLLLPLSSSP
jgi:hypothetical protein